jgi:hypothetical protein
MAHEQVIQPICPSSPSFMSEAEHDQYSPKHIVHYLRILEGQKAMKATKGECETECEDELLDLVGIKPLGLTRTPKSDPGSYARG